MHQDFVIRGALNDFTMDKRRMFQNETHFTYNTAKEKVNQLFSMKDLISDFPTKFHSEWKTVQAKIYDLVKNVFALCVHDSPGLKGERVGHGLIPDRSSLRS